MVFVNVFFFFLGLLLFASSLYSELVVLLLLNDFRVLELLFYDNNIIECR